jgi:hypothetical protein
MGSVSINSTSDEVATYLSYDIYVFTSSHGAELQLYFIITLEIDPADRMRYDIMVDGDPVGPYRLLSQPAEVGGLPNDWASAVQDSVWARKHRLTSDQLRPGKHTVKLRLRHSNLLLEKFSCRPGWGQRKLLRPNTQLLLEN